MIEEVAVFGRGEGVDHQLGNEGDRHEDAPLAGVFAEQLPSPA